MDIGEDLLQATYNLIKYLADKTEDEQEFCLLDEVRRNLEAYIDN